MLEFMAAAKALADPNRVRLLLALEGRELCVCQLIELAGLAPSTVSKHLSILRMARLIEGRKVGRWMFYRLPEKSSSCAVQGALMWVRAALAQDDQTLEDRKHLEEILEMDPEDLCRKQCCR